MLLLDRRNDKVIQPMSRNDDDLWQDSEKLASAFEQLGKQIYRQESERSYAIVGGVELEESLGTLLLSFCVDDKQTEKALESTLGSFYVRINVAWILGLISRDEYDDLHLIREIRNYFAHGTEGVSFEDKQVAERCGKLKTIRKNHVTNEDALMIYMGSVVVLKELLFDRMASAIQSKRATPDEIDPKSWRDL
jgi:DNA-binding MltR family transcriptional regulator